MSSELTPSKRPHDEVEGEANGKGKLQKSEENKSYKHSQGSIVFRVLCPDSKSAKISEIHGANIRVEEAIPGCNERVVVIGKDTDKPEEDNDLQKALLLVFESMVDNDMDESIVVMRLLVVSTQVGCLLGKSESGGAQIRILPKDKLPACASSLDELVQISGEVSSVRKAVEYFSQQLLEHASNDSNTNTKTTISQQDPPHGRGGGRFGNLTDMLTYRLICPDEKVGGVIGKGGAIVKALKHETGCDIKVLERIPGSDDRVIVISGPAVPNERICAPQDAVLRVQTRVFRAAPAPPPGPDSKGVTAKVIVSAHQIGCILGKGGSVISEMRKSTGAFIRILGKDQTPLYAAENQEVVQINGEFEAVQEALFQITTALRNHYFRDAFPAYMGRGRGRSRPISPPSFNRFDGFHPHDDHPNPYIQRFPWGAPQGIEGGFSQFGRRMGGFGGGSHQAVITNTTVEVVVPRNVVSCIYGEDGGCLKQIREISDARITITDPKPGAKETLIVISGTPEQAHAAQSLIQAFVISETQVS